MNAVPLGLSSERVKVETRKIQVTRGLGALEGIQPAPNAGHEIRTNPLPSPLLEEFPECRVPKTLDHSFISNTTCDTCKPSCYSLLARVIAAAGGIWPPGRLSDDTW